MKPGDLLLGVFDFFAFVLPGIMATWLLAQYIPPAVLREALTFNVADQQSPHEWVLLTAFLLSSYTLGHFVSLMGAQLDSSYDHWRQRTRPHATDKTYHAARELHRQLDGEIFGGSLTTLKWAKAYIQVQASAARGEIDRLEADQKFFRSLVVIFALYAAHFFLGQSAPLIGLACIGAAMFSYHRFRDQRWKETELIFATAVIVHRIGVVKRLPRTGLSSESGGRACRARLIEPRRRVGALRRYTASVSAIRARRSVAAISSSIGCPPSPGEGLLALMMLLSSLRAARVTGDDGNWQLASAQRPAGAHRGLDLRSYSLIPHRCRLDQDRRRRLAAPPGGLQAMHQVYRADVLDTLDSRPKNASPAARLPAPCPKTEPRGSRPQPARLTCRCASRP
jgi:hypothetical protein